MRIAILGATGVFARHLLPRLAADGHELIAIARDPNRATTAQALGIEQRAGDIFDETSLTEALAGAELCLNLATALPGPSGRGSFEANDQLRRDGVPVLLRGLQNAGVTRLLQQSIALIATSGEDLNDGTISPVPQGDGLAAKTLRAALAMETAVQAAPLDWTILRGGLFYGPGTGLDDTWFDQAAAGKLLMAGAGADFLSLVHIADMAEATRRAVSRSNPGQILAISDDEPVRWRDIFGHIATLSGGPAPIQGGPPRFASFRVSNARARDLLDWQPHYPSYRQGLAR
ncbi:NAD(P)-dependent oxidoreductase [Pseudooceanicola sp.]|uniref:NAD-dependent epimerase/dehydratase family protein n=1 Tax=Pseudooceanicola sp. TaxID=1914328 RepID=UPI00262609D5|nr:NAD(P)-dependent oxidoreductase [Pseudooceanicola sp.]MDF1854323.1 NAD(P)-dependent oxidoreductase [Pseudooceanicola sp.]